MQPQQPYTGQIFQPTQAYTPTTPQPFYGNNFEDEPPLLEELGINFDHIWQKNTHSFTPLESSRWQHHEWDWFGRTNGFLPCFWSYIVTGWQNPVWLRIWNQCNWMPRNVLFIKLNEYDWCFIWLCGKCPWILSSSYDPAFQLRSDIFFAVSTDLYFGSWLTNSV